MRVSSLFEHWVPLSFLLAGLHLLAAALLISIIAWGRHGRRLVPMVSCLVTVAAITLMYTTMTRSSDIPIDWITVLTRGFEERSIRHLYARGVDAGPNFAFVLSAFASGSPPNLHEVVWLNLLLAMVNAAIVLHLAIYIAGPVWALPWTIVFALNPSMFLAAFSELPTNLLALYFWVGVLGWGVLNDAPEQSRMIRALAGVLCALITAIMLLTRAEVAAIGMIALALHLGHALLGPERWSKALRRLREACERLLIFLSDHLVLVAVLGVASWIGLPKGVPFGSRSSLAGLYPFNPSILELFVFLPMLMFPIGATIAVFFGFTEAITRFRRFGGLPLALLVIVRAYFGVQDSYLEMGRYLGYVLPALVLLGLLGKAGFDALTERWRPNCRRAARIAYVMAWLTLPLPGVVEFYLRSEYNEFTTASAGLSQLLLDRNTQKEVRHLLALTERNPECVFIGRTIDYRRDFRVRPEYNYAIFGASLAAPVFIPEKSAPLDEVIKQYASEAACVRLHYGGDCNVRFGDRCKQFVAGRRLIDEERFWSRPYNSNPFDNGAPDIVLATYAWP